MYEICIHNVNEGYVVSHFSQCKYITNYIIMFMISQLLQMSGEVPGRTGSETKAVQRILKWLDIVIELLDYIYITFRMRSCSPTIKISYWYKITDCRKGPLEAF